MIKVEFEKLIYRRKESEIKDLSSNSKIIKLDQSNRKKEQKIKIRKKGIKRRKKIIKN